MKKHTVELFLSSFFAVLNAKIVECSIEENKVKGIVGWNEEDNTQSFSWVILYDEFDLSAMTQLCVFLTQQKLVRGDKILISPFELNTLLCRNGWDKAAADMTIEKICSIDIKMIDDGEETDSFFIHF